MIRSSPAPMLVGPMAAAATHATRALQYLLSSPKSPISRSCSAPIRVMSRLPESARSGFDSWISIWLSVKKVVRIRRFRCLRI